MRELKERCCSPRGSHVLAKSLLKGRRPQGAPGPFHVAFTDSVLKEISLNGWIDPNLGRSASLSEGLPAAFSDKDRRLRGKVGLPLKSKMASILHLPLLRMALKGFLVFPE